MATLAHNHVHLRHLQRWALPSLTVARPGLAQPGPEVAAPQDIPRDMGGFESARMSRELGREMPDNALRRQKSANPVLAALMNMPTRRFVVLVAGVALLALGLLALDFPVFLPDFDQWGFQIDCGSGFQSALAQAGIADSSGHHYVDQCQAAVGVRREWSIPVVAAGVLMLGALLVRPSVNARA
jgi:hypothetical protein